MNVLDLFSGIGGFSLGLERAGFQTVAFCENEPFCQQVLHKHWPDVPIYDDVRELSRGRLDADGIAGIDVICGGFPCQDISVAGQGAGIEGERSGLWSEFARLIGEIRPRYVIVENVSALLGRGLGTVLGDLAALGYDAEWHCIPASACGAPHRRDRVWILGYASEQRWEHWRNSAGRVALEENALEKGKWKQGEYAPYRSSADVADTTRQRFRKTRPDIQRQAQRSASRGDVPDADDIHAQGQQRRRDDPIVRREHIERQARLSRGAGRHHDWATEPAMGRVVDGLPDRVGQLKAYGNAVVPQIPEMIGRAILEAEAA